MLAPTRPGRSSSCATCGSATGWPEPEGLGSPHRQVQSTEVRPSGRQDRIDLVPSPQVAPDERRYASLVAEAIAVLRQVPPAVGGPVVLDGLAGYDLDEVAAALAQDL